MGEKMTGSHLALILLCALVMFFVCAAAVFIGLYFAKYSEKNGRMFNLCTAVGRSKIIFIHIFIQVSNTVTIL